MSIQGHSGNEIADLLGISINTVKTQKNRGKLEEKSSLNRGGPPSLVFFLAAFFLRIPTSRCGGAQSRIKGLFLRRLEKV